MPPIIIRCHDLHDSLALTKSKYVNVMQFLIQNNLIFSSFLNDDTKLVYECLL